MATRTEQQKSTARLARVKKTLARRTLDLSTAKQKLKDETATRKATTQALRQCERQSARLQIESGHIHKELRSVSHRILSAQEDERKRISRELHDLVGQTLTAINVHLANLRVETTRNSKGITTNIARTERLVEQSVDKVHRFARELRPAVLDDLGLIPALRSFMRSFMSETGIRVSLTAFAALEDDVGNAERTVLYRVVQEALTNVARHSNASRADVCIRQIKNGVRMKITDDGCGFDANRTLHSRKTKRIGLLGMRERVEMVGGAFSIESSPGHGTTINAYIPSQLPPAKRGAR